MDPNLNSMNDGQTHRLKLMQDPTVREYRECSDSFESASRGRSDRPRGGGRGGRGGGFVGVRIGRHGPGRYRILSILEFPATTNIALECLLAWTLNLSYPA